MDATELPWERRTAPAVQPANWSFSNRDKCQYHWPGAGDPERALTLECYFGLTMSGTDKDQDQSRTPSTGVVVDTKPKTKKPSMYKVLMLNDDYTPMEFVVHVLERFFGKPREEATLIMLHVHRRGVGICGVFTYEVAETKVSQVVDYARQHQHPLQCTLEKE
jgi:ATP-dependent Clp protease adaptor protein ClpS